MRRLLVRHWFPLVTITSIVLLLTRLIWATGSFGDTHDGIFHVVRMTELWDMLRNGQFPVRWAGNLDHGYGLPLFNYVYPLPYYLGLPIVALGFSPFWAVKLVTIMAYLIGGFGIYFLGRKHKFIALAGSILYLTTPYQLLNIFVRGALGETLALAILPWVVITGLDLSKHKLRWYHPIPLSCLFLSHSFLSFIFLPFYLVLVYRSNASKLIISTLLSLGLASWYLVPAIFESNLLKSVVNSDFTFHYSDHFIYPLQLLWSRWGVGFSVGGAGDDLSFQLGVAQVLIFTISSYLALKAKKPIVTILIIVSIFLMLPVSNFIWKIFTPLQLVQFPWRLLFLPTFLIVYQFLQTGPRSHTIIIPICILTLGFAIYFAHPRYPLNSSQYMTKWYTERYGTTTSSRTELLPKWVSGTPSPEFLSKNYFPTWQLTDSQGQVISIYPSDTGQIAYDKSLTSDDQLTLSIRQTSIEICANVISVISFLLVLGFSYIPGRKLPV
ncbi:MAG: 6-pyruvoyl-tetrahydropterin synthase-related protein [bacterium]